MTADRWQQLETIFQAALERPASERAAFLAQACAGDAALLQEAEKLLASFDSASDFLETPAADSLGLAGVTATIAPGQRVAHYEILSALGAGGMGEVYLARDPRLERQVALKLLPAQFSRDAAWVERFTREARAASALNHPNILTIYEIGADAGTHFIAAEYVAGQTLRQRLQAGRLPARESLDIAGQIASALAAAHAAGIVHRDIKPENVMLRPDGLVKLLDFGLAKPLRSETTTGDLQRPAAAGLQTDPRHLLGTLAYLSPEQARGETLDQRSDLFSLGVVLYEMLAGARPFAGADAAATLDAILHQPPAPLTATVLPATPGLTTLERLVCRTLEKERAARYQHAEQLRTELKDLERELAPPPQAYAAAARGRRGKIAVALAVGAALVVTVWFTWSNWRRENRQAPALAASWRNATAAKLTDQPGPELFPSLAPDGQFLVYASQAAGNWDIWRQRVSERASERQLVNLTKDSAADETQPAFSPDGQWIAFQSGGGNTGGISVMDVAGSQRRRLTSEGFHPTWSADGKELYCVRENVIDPDSRTASYRRVWAVTVATGQQRLLFTDDMAQPQLSPHGWRIAYWGVPPGSTQRDIWTRPSNGGAPVAVTPVAVTNDAAVDWNPVWAPDGRHLYFASNRAGSMNLWRVALDEQTGRVLGDPEQIPTPASYSQHPALTRDGRRLAFVELIQNKNLYRLGFDPARGKIAGPPVAITKGSRRADDLALSPDGQWLAFISEEGPHQDLFLVKSDGTGEWRNVTQDAAHNRGPVWSPDGQRLATYSDYGGSYEIWAHNTAGGGLQQLTDTGGVKAYFPLWSPLGAGLVFTQTGGQPFVIEPVGRGTATPPQPLIPATERDMAFWPIAWSGDGKRLAGRWRAPGSQSYSLGSYSFESRQFQRLLKDDIRVMAWLNDNRRLLLAQAGKLLLLDTATGQVEEIHSLAPWQINRLSLSRDNRTLYFSMEDRQADIWMLKLEE